MRRRHRSTFALIALFLWFGGCADPASPTITDVDVAHAAWLESSPDDYTFEVATASSWFPKSGYYRVEVRDRHVVGAVDEDDRATEFHLTLDEVWERVLAARAANQLNSARFSPRGVPLDVDFGQWELDGGIRYWIRNFTPR